MDIHREHVMVPDGRGMEGNEEVRGVRSINRWLQNSPRDIKHSIGNGEAKELICMTHNMNNVGGIA